MTISEFNKWVLFFSYNPSLEQIIDTQLSRLICQNQEENKYTESLINTMMTIPEESKPEIIEQLKQQQVINKLKEL